MGHGFALLLTPGSEGGTFVVVMPPVTQARVQFGDKLREELGRQKISQRELARRLSGGRDGKALDVQRRAIRRHLLNQHRPTSATRTTYALALGLPADHFENDDDEEADELAVLIVELLARLRLTVDEAVERRLGASA